MKEASAADALDALAVALEHESVSLEDVRAWKAQLRERVLTSKEREKACERVYTAAQMQLAKGNGAGGEEAMQAALDAVLTRCSRSA